LVDYELVYCYAYPEKYLDKINWITISVWLTWSSLKAAV
jgi:hypothetical protein